MDLNLSTENGSGKKETLIKKLLVRLFAQSIILIEKGKGQEENRNYR